MKPTERPCADPQIISQEGFEGWAVLLHPQTGESIGLGAVGMTIWKLLDGEHRVDEIAAAVKAGCEDAPDSVLEDTLAFVEDLHRRGFVQAGE
jgi:hypothetical protein